VILLKSKILYVIFILLCFLCFSACASRELNSFNLVTSVGIDKDEAGYMVTYQVLNPKAVVSQKTVNESPFFLYSEKGNSLDEIYKRVTTQSSRKMYAAHVRSVIISEDLARDGLKEIVDYLFRSGEYHNDFYFIIAKGTTANQILSTITTVETVSGVKLYESLENSKNWWAATDSLKIVEMINNINAKGINPVLAGVEFFQKTEGMDNIETLEKSNSGKLKLTAMGAFRNDKLVGWLNESESIAYTYIVGKAKNTSGCVDYDENTRVSLNIDMKKSKVKVSLSEDKPVINVKLSAEMIITSQKGDVDFTDEKNLNKLNSMVNEQIIDSCEKALYKAQQELKTDIFGFGERIHSAYPKVWDKLKDNWNNEFTTLQVNFSADTKTMDLGQNLKPIISEQE